MGARDFLREVCDHSGHGVTAQTARSRPSPAAAGVFSDFCSSLARKATGMGRGRWT